jgi:3-hydroxyacyl-CoA dehydrogenase
LRQSVSALADIGAVEASAVDEVLARVSTHDDLAAALTPCAADPRELDSIVQTTLRAFVPVFGRLQMTDLIGHDRLRDISHARYPELATDQTASRTIEQHVNDGQLGVKTARGFYDDNDKRLAELTGKLYQVARRVADSPDP